MTDVAEQLDDPRAMLAQLSAWRKSGDLKLGADKRRFGAQLRQVLEAVRDDPRCIGDLKDIKGAEILAAAADQEDLRANAAVLRKAARTLRAARTPEDIKAWRANVWPQTQTAIGSLKTRLREAWRKSCQAESQPLENMGRVLLKLTITKPLGQDMIAVAAEANHLASIFPPGEKERQALERLKEGGLQLRSRLKSQGGGEELIGFLLKAAEGMATLADLSDDTLAWLRKNSVSTAFKIRLG